MIDDPRRLSAWCEGDLHSQCASGRDVEDPCRCPCHVLDVFEEAFRGSESPADDGGVSWSHHAYQREYEGTGGPQMPEMRGVWTGRRYNRLVGIVADWGHYARWSLMDGINVILEGCCSTCEEGREKVQELVLG